MQKMKFTTLPRGINACWCWFRFSSFPPTWTRNIYPSVMLWVWVCGSISLQKYSPDGSFHLPVFSKESTAFTFSSQPPQSCYGKLVCTQSYFWSFTKDSLSIILMHFHCHSLCLRPIYYIKSKKRKKNSSKIFAFCQSKIFFLSPIIHSAHQRVLMFFVIISSWIGHIRSRLLIKTQYRNEQLFFQETVNLSGYILLQKDVKYSHTSG